ncbi:hypothetical protein [Thomasclavelia ramosa]|uniref:hypothetical protein n=1 Tax=Thomasclavelia ramosa TaxID=1547 RepID=UPI003DA5F14B
MKKFIKWFCLFITYGFIIAVLQANNASNNTITLCSAALLVIIFLLWKFKKNKKETPQENHTETLNKEYGKSIKTSLNNDEVLEKYTNRQIENENRAMNETLIKTSNNPMDIKPKHDLSYDEEYLNTVLEDGKTIKEHMQEDLKDAIIRSQGMDNQEDIELNELEKQFINEFKNSIKPFNLDTEIRYNRMSNKCLNFSFRDMQIGRIKLNGRKMWIQVLYDKEPISENFDIKTIDEAYTYIDNWIEYLNYLIRE